MIKLWKGAFKIILEDFQNGNWEGVVAGTLLLTIATLTVLYFLLSAIVQLPVSLSVLYVALTVWFGEYVNSLGTKKDE